MQMGLPDPSIGDQAPAVPNRLQTIPLKTNQLNLVQDWIHALK
jgi:hypothetical protein